jgi:hypothetical protein
VIPDRQKVALNRIGIHTIQNVLHHSPNDLTNRSGLSQTECLDILVLCKELTAKYDSDLLLGSSVYDLVLDFQTNPSKSPITTFSSAIDNLFGGGIPIGYSTEIYGEPGFVDLMS